MSNIEKWQTDTGIAIRKIDGEVITDTESLEVIYKRAKLDDVFERFVFGEPRIADPSHITDEEDLEHAIRKYVVGMFPFISHGDEVNVPFIRAAFEKVVDGMNIAASKKLGFEPHGPGRALLIFAGIREPKAHQYVAHRDDEYWHSQFLRQFEDYSDFPEASLQNRAMTYTFSCFKGFALAPFSYVQQADHAS